MGIPHDLQPRGLWRRMAGHDLANRIAASGCRDFGPRPGSYRLAKEAWDHGIEAALLVGGGSRPRRGRNPESRRGGSARILAPKRRLLLAKGVFCQAGEPLRLKWQR